MLRAARPYIQETFTVRPSVRDGSDSSGGRRTWIYFPGAQITKSCLHSSKMDVDTRQNKTECCVLAWREQKAKLRFQEGKKVK